MTEGNEIRCRLTYPGKTPKTELLEKTEPALLKTVRAFGGQADSPPNRLIFGDNLPVLRSLLQAKRQGGLVNADGSNGVKLIYIDPPFATSQDFRASQGQLAYGDRLVGANYVEFLRQRLVFLRELLAPGGSIYVHLDETKSHYIKVILDELFGEENFQRELIWRIGWVSGFKTQAKNWIRNHDVLLFYTKGPDFTFNKEYIPYPEGYTRRDGSPPTGKGYPMEDTWNCYEVDRMPSIQIMSFSGEKTGFPTQKNENLLARIIRASSNPGDLVLDAFAGSGTTLAVAEKLGRRWIGIDNSKLALCTIQKRLLQLRAEVGNTGPALAVKPFVLERTEAAAARNCPPEVQVNYSQDLAAQLVLSLQDFRSQAGEGEKGPENSPHEANRTNFLMMMVDFDFTGGPPAIDTVYFQEELEKSDWCVRLPADSLGAELAVIYVDNYGNERQQLTGTEVVLGSDLRDGTETD